MVGRIDDGAAAPGPVTPGSDNARRQPGVGGRGGSGQRESTSGAAARARRRYVALTRRLRDATAWAEELQHARLYASALAGLRSRAADQARAELELFVPLARAGFRAAWQHAFPGAVVPPCDDIEELHQLVYWLRRERAE